MPLAYLVDYVAEGKVKNYECFAGCLNLSFAFVEGESLLMALKDIALSSGRYIQEGSFFS